jgi:hypothetical protein
MKLTWHGPISLTFVPLSNDWGDRLLGTYLDWTDRDERWDAYVGVPGTSGVPWAT